MHKQSPLQRIVVAAVIALVCCSQPPTLNAQDSPETKAGPIRIDAKDEKALHENLGKNATVFGLIKRTRDWDGGANFLNFEDDKFMLICFESDYANFPEGRPAKTLRDKNVEVTGYINEYKGKLQIKLTHPEQVKIIEPKAEEKPEDTGGTEEKKEKAPPPPKPEKIDPKKYFC